MRILKVIVVLGLLGVLAVGYSIWRGYRAVALANDAWDDVHQKRYHSAIAKLEKSIRLRDDIPEAQNLLGAAYLSVDRTNDAKICFLNAIALKPSMIEAQINLAVLYERENNYQACLEHLDAVINSHPANPEPLWRKGSVYAELEEYDQAIRWLKMALQQDADYVPGWYALGYVYYRLANEKDAVAAYTRAAELSPDSAEVHYDLGFVLSKFGRYRDAIPAFQAAIRVQPDHTNAHYCVGIAYLHVGDAESAQIEYEKLKGIDRDMADRLWQQIQTEGKEPADLPPLQITG